MNWILNGWTLLLIAAILLASTLIYLIVRPRDKSAQQAKKKHADISAEVDRLLGGRSVAGSFSVGRSSTDDQPVDEDVQATAEAALRRLQDQ